MEVIIAAAISAGVTLLVCILNNKSEQSKTRALIEYQLSELKKQVEKHNGVIERTFILEGDVRELRHEVSDLKGYHRPN